MTRQTIHERIPIGPRAGMSDVDVRSIAGSCAEIEKLAGQPNPNNTHPFRAIPGETHGMIGLWCNGLDFWVVAVEASSGNDPSWNTVWISHSPREDIWTERAKWITKGNSSGARAYYLDCVMASFGLPRWSD